MMVFVWGIMALPMGILMLYETSAKLLQATLVYNEPLGVGGVWGTYMVAMSNAQFTTIERKTV